MSQSEEGRPETADGLAGKIDAWIDLRDSYGRREGANVSDREDIDEANNLIIDCQRDYKKITGEYYVGSTR
jgi:hypothetical protein